MCGWDWSSVKSQKSDWVRDKKLNVLAQVALDPEPELTRLGIPQIWKFVTKEDDRKVAELVISQQVFQRSYIITPGTRPEAVDILRKAFDETDWSTNVELRVRCIRQLQQAMRDHVEELRDITVSEVGAPVMLTEGAQLEGPVEDLSFAADTAES